MKLPDFYPNEMRWDEYKRFHNKHRNGMVLFENGEAILTSGNFDPNSRSYTRPAFHPNTSLRIVTTTDDDCPKLKWVPTPELEAALRSIYQDPDKLFAKHIPKVWLSPGGYQTLLIDADTGRAVCLDTRRDTRHDGWKHVAVRINTTYGFRSNIVAYIPGNGADALANKVRVHVPKNLHPDEVKAWTLLREQCTVWYSLTDGDIRAVAPKYWSVGREGWEYQKPMPLRALTDGANTKLEDMSGERRVQLALHGIAKEHQDAYVDYVKVAQ